MELKKFTGSNSLCNYYRLLIRERFIICGDENSHGGARERIKTKRKQLSRKEITVEVTKMEEDEKESLGGGTDEDK